MVRRTGKVRQAGVHFNYFDFKVKVNFKFTLFLVVRVKKLILCICKIGLIGNVGDGQLINELIGFPLYRNL